MNGENGPMNPFAEKFAKSVEARIEADKIKNTHNNAVYLFKNRDNFFGADNEEKKSEIAVKIFSSFNRTPQYTDFNSMVEASKDAGKNPRIAFGDIDSLAESVQIVMDMSVLGTNLITDEMTAEQIDDNLIEEMKGIGKRIKEKRLMDNVKDNLIEINSKIEQGNLFNTQDKVVRSDVYQKWGEKVKTLPESSYVKKYVEVARSVFEDLGLEVVDDSQKKLDMVVEKISAVADVLSESGISEPDGRAIVENQHAKDPGKEYRSPYEIDPRSFVDAIFNQTSPRLYFTPAPEWVRKLPPKEQYLLKIQQKLANGAEYKLGVKDISADKARQSEVYNFPETELKYIYEMPGVKEAMETFVGDLFEPYREDGRIFLRLKLSGDGKLDPLVAKKCGDIGSNFSFEDYKEEMFKKMALRKLYPAKIGEINGDWETVYKGVIEDYIKKTRGDFKENKRNIGRTDNRTDAELEHKWITDNALEEKKAVATAWNFLFVGNIVESADTGRNLKPSQINSDKIRTMMMPLEKFLQKASIRKGKVQGSEELFGGSLALWAKRRLEEDGTNFSQKLVYAADNDRTKMTDEQAQWRLMPKRTMCSFNDEYHVKTKDGQEMTFSEALLNKKEIDFKENDLDVFVSLRDTWDEVISVSPFLIGKGEYSPVQQPEKFSSAVEKLKGLVTGINKLRLTPEEADKQKRTFGHEKYVDCPEFYAWLLANAVGIEINLDTPILNRTAMKADSDTYNDHINNLVRLLNLDPSISLKTKEILNGKSWLSAKRAISVAERIASSRESKRRAEEKRKRN